jgi:hypothetical protein
MVGNRIRGTGLIRNLPVIAGLMLSLNGCANAVNNEKSSLNSLVAHIQAAQATCTQKKLPLASQIISCNYNEVAPYVKSYSEYLLPYYTTWRDEHLIAAQEYDSYVRGPELKPYNDAFGLAGAKFNTALHSVEPQYLTKGSKLDVDIKNKMISANCASTKKVVSNTCLRNAIMPVWTELSPNTVTVLSAEYDQLLLAAKAYDDKAGPLLDAARQKFMEAHAASNQRFQAGLEAIVKSKISFAAAQDAETRQNSETAAKGVATVLGAVLYLGAAFAEGYATGAAARPAPYQASPTINCMSNTIGSYTYTNCH